MILAIGNSGDYEFSAFNAVLAELKIKGQDAVLFKQDKCLDDEYLVFEAINEKINYLVIINGIDYDIEDFSAIWYMKPHLPLELLQFEPAEYRQFIHNQFRAMRTALWSVFQHKKWIDNPWVIEKAENKIYQLTLAKKAGLSIPDTLITSDPERVKSFYEKHDGNIIVKPLGVSPMINEVLYTNILTPEHLKNIDTIKMSPSIFQVRVPKAYELRITIVGEEIFPAKINSQEDEQTSLDWRRKPKLNDFEVKMEQTSLPKNIEENLRHFMEMLGLRFGCIDMIVTPSGDYIFLEINPNGQWYFVQLHTEAEISKALAKLLL